MIKFRARDARGRHRGAMVDAHHSFSFADYNDPKNMGFRDLRVLNEDWVVPGAGFVEHGHADMEIITLVLEGAIIHRDSLGNEHRITRGEAQAMSAGTGIRHSEMNASPDQRAHALQIWIIPTALGGTPRYGQRRLPEDRNGFVLVASPDGRDGSLPLRQDAVMEIARLDEGVTLERGLSAGRGYWAQVISGIIGLNGTEMREGDGAALTEESRLSIEAETDAEILLIDLP